MPLVAHNFHNYLHIFIMYLSRPDLCEAQEKWFHTINVYMGGNYPNTSNPTSFRNRFVNLANVHIKKATRRESHQFKAGASLNLHSYSLTPINWGDFYVLHNLLRHDQLNQT